MQRSDRLVRTVILRCCAAAVVGSFAAGPAYALRMTRMPAHLQTSVLEPVQREISLKLPLRQPVFHWTFLSRKDLLAGKLTLHIGRGDQTTTVTIFKNGEFSEGWEALPLPAANSGEVYFGFRSTRKYATAPDDLLKIELHVTQDLNGIGPLETGVLPAGTYTAQGTYSGLIDEYDVPDPQNNLPEETIAKLRELYDFKAFMENWEAQWPLQRIENKGWLAPAQRKQFEDLLQLLREEDAEN